MPLGPSSGGVGVTPPRAWGISSPRRPLLCWCQYEHIWTQPFPPHINGSDVFNHKAHSYQRAPHADPGHTSTAADLNPPARPRHRFSSRTRFQCQTSRLQNGGGHRKAERQSALEGTTDHGNVHRIALVRPTRRGSAGNGLITRAALPGGGCTKGKGGEARAVGCTGCCAWRPVQLPARAKIKNRQQIMRGNATSAFHCDRQYVP